MAETQEAATAAAGVSPPQEKGTLENVPGATEQPTVTTNGKANAHKKPPAKKTAAATDAKPVIPDSATIFTLPIAEITEDKSPRHEPANLYDLGWVLVGKHPTWQPPAVEEGETAETRTPLAEMATSDNFDLVAQFVSLIEEHEGVPDRKVIPSAPQSIVELAEDLTTYRQIYPILVQRLTKGWSIVDGGRRTTAILYAHAKGRLDRHNKVKDGWPQCPATIQAVNADRLKKADVERLAMIANLSRKQFTPLQLARMYYEKTQETDPSTGRKYTMKAAAEALGVMGEKSYSSFRAYHAMGKPFEPAVKEDGVVVKPSTGLSDADRRKLALGLMNLTDAMHKALGEKQQAPEGEKKKKAGLRPLKEFQAKFDDTPEDQKEIRSLLAWAMGLTLAQATKESVHRIQKVEAKEIRVARKNRKKNAA